MPLVIIVTANYIHSYMNLNWSGHKHELLHVDHAHHITIDETYIYCCSKNITKKKEVDLLKCSYIP